MPLLSSWIKHEWNVLYELILGDAVFSMFVVAPLVVAMWWSTWKLMDLYDEYFPRAQTFILGIIVHILFTILRSAVFLIKYIHTTHDLSSKG
jgi:hypothetical protein